MRMKIMKTRYVLKGSINMILVTCLRSLRIHSRELT